MLKDTLWSGQARRLKGAVCEREGYEVRNGAEDRVVDFGKEEDRAVIVRSFDIGTHVRGRRGSQSTYGFGRLLCHDLGIHSEHVPLFRAGTAHNQQAHILNSRSCQIA